MFELKPLSKEAIPKALEKAERYRLLNEPRVAESICRDVLQTDPDNQQAIVMLVLALTDQFGNTVSLGAKEVMQEISKLKDEYERAYYTGIVYERRAKARLNMGMHGSDHDAYELLEDAMEWFEKAEAIHPAGNEDAILRWNTCARIITQNKLRPRGEDDFRPYLE